ncbi:hypothetical protein KC19_2G092900 [Ceratodon purpureus]|uniref:Uncharacterized protein n=1 Tax=Ceratodon purpureus TaxID=3225 RepID=A0A8T0IRW1_CERPU|nr:hypothetical protein KC19_2G092900 [Ceratodon purpureus]
MDIRSILLTNPEQERRHMNWTVIPRNNVQKELRNSNAIEEQNLQDILNLTTAQLLQFIPANSSERIQTLILYVDTNDIRMRRNLELLSQSAARPFSHIQTALQLKLSIEQIDHDMRTNVDKAHICEAYLNPKMVFPQNWCKEKLV